MIDRTLTVKSDARNFAVRQLFKEQFCCACALLTLLLSFYFLSMLEVVFCIQQICMYVCMYVCMYGVLNSLTRVMNVQPADQQ